MQRTGADPTVVCDRGKTPREYSMDEEVQQLLAREERWWRRRGLAWVTADGPADRGRANATSAQ